RVERLVDHQGLCEFPDALVAGQRPDRLFILLAQRFQIDPFAVQGPGIELRHEKRLWVNVRTQRPWNESGSDKRDSPQDLQYHDLPRRDQRMVRVGKSINIQTLCP